MVKILKFELYIVTNEDDSLRCDSFIIPYFSVITTITTTTTITTRGPRGPKKPPVMGVCEEEVEIFF